MRVCIKCLFRIQYECVILSSIRVCNDVIAVYSENKLQHYATAYRNHKSAGEKLGLFRFCKFFIYFFSEYIMTRIMNNRNENVKQKTKHLDILKAG